MRFRDHVDMGDIVELAARYRDEGADELVFYDITASPEGRTLDYGWVRRVARLLDIPFCVAGGIRSRRSGRPRCLDAGADKVSINSPALERPELIDEMAARLRRAMRRRRHRQLRSRTANGACTSTPAIPNTQRDCRRRDAGLDREAQRARRRRDRAQLHGQDGVRRGYDLDQLSTRPGELSVPLVASGGAGAPQHFLDVFVEADVYGALAASVFHTGAIAIPELKHYLHVQGVPVRLQATRNDRDD